MNPRRIIIIPFIHGKLTHNGRMGEPDIHWIMEKWLERHPKIKTKTQDIRVRCLTAARQTLSVPR